jgi:beta-glucanase (GH16 family)
MKNQGNRSLMQLSAQGVLLFAMAFGFHAVFSATPLQASKEVSGRHGPATWGTPDQPWGTRRPVTSADRKLIATYRSGHKPLTFSTDFRDQAQFNSEWQPQSDEKAGMKSCRRPENVQLSGQGLRLRTLAARDCQTEWSTGAITSTFRQKYGFFEARLKIADIGGMNNAFWLTTTDDYEIDVTEVRYPNYDHMNLCNWDKSVKSHCVGLGVKFVDNLSDDFHDYGVLWTPNELIFEVDGDPVGVIMTSGVIGGTANIRFSSALGDSFGKIPADPVGHDMVVPSLRVYAY